MRASERGIPRVHPTQKPIAVMEWVLEQKTGPGQTVFDPFMGSGTTGIACARLGRRFVGVEIDEAHFQTACARIGDGLRSGTQTNHRATRDRLRDGTF
ncbi:MAG: site-specific DNA-methyltransferase [Alphaproteobacteria bacterium]|nr:site-specific DNA-methyltransferase [Alphaproteobacteria bacterium]